MRAKTSGYYSGVPNITAGFKKFATDFEKSLNCNGICYPGLFYYFRSIKEGPPSKNCINGFTELFKDKALAIGILLLVSFFLTFLSHINSYPIC